ncbi:glycine cleavage system protein T [Kouleothrix aurantiaca]|jgi:aminomethyltransferase|uniref:aminomethyltransferase n=1 Tax=Kouleothrix aurantiaca TaxID=186479 RepID=A0A0P9DCX2_9CHLR|nr:glycine cleavage system protein T [Kouleothrix aurantiaca]
MPERRTPLYDNHIRLGAQMVKGGGDYMFPLSYTSPVEEHVNTRTNVGMQDLSTMGEVDVKGPGAERLLNQLLVNEIKDLLPGQARYSTMCREDGGVVDDITVYKFNDEHYMVVTSSGPRKKTARWIADHAVGTSTYVTDISPAVALPVVQGPRSRDFLKAVAQNVDIDALRFFRFAPARINDTELLISRSGYTGELGYELYTPAEEAGALWDYLVQQGREFGLKPYGVAAMQTLRLEKAFPLYGNDINEDYTPFHVGLDRWIRFDKRDFIGRDALLRLQQTGLDRRWVGLTLQGDIPAAVNATVWSVGAVNPNDETMYSGPEAGSKKDRILPGEEVGHVTFSERGHTVGKILALAYVRTSHSYPGSRLLVDVKGKPVPAVVTPTPFFDPQGARLRAKA